jgi:hypothetical protein
MYSAAAEKRIAGPRNIPRETMFSDQPAGFLFAHPGEIPAGIFRRACFHSVLMVTSDTGASIPST